MGCVHSSVFAFDTPICSVVLRVPAIVCFALEFSGSFLYRSFNYCCLGWDNLFIKVQKCVKSEYQVNLFCRISKDKTHSDKSFSFAV